MSHNNPQLFLNFAKNRSRVYWLLSHLIERPEPEALADLIAKLNATELGEEDALSSSLVKIKESLKVEDLAGLSTTLLIEHTRLFRGIRKGYGPPPPYESIYRGERNVNGETTLDVMTTYATYGFDYEGFQGPKDHIKIELVFLAFLADQEKKAREDENEDYARQLVQAQHNFLESNLVSFTAKLYEEVCKTDENGFYSEITNLMKLYVEQDLETLTYLLQESS